jgi:hypothetical protein
MAYNLANVIGGAKSLNFNITTDQLIPINLPPGITNYNIRRITLYGASVSLTLAVGGFYNAASKPSGGILVAATQAYSTLTGSTLWFDATLASLPLNTVQTASGIYLSLTTGQGSAATANVVVYGDLLQ